MQRKIAFMGTPNFCLPILKNIYQNGYEISVVYTQPPRKSNRGQKIEKSPVHLLSETLALNVRTPDQLKNNKSYACSTATKFGKLKTDLNKYYYDLNYKDGR